MFKIKLILKKKKIKSVKKIWLNKSFLYKNIILNKLLNSIVKSNNIPLILQLQSKSKKKNKPSVNELKDICVISGKEKSVTKSLKINRNPLNRLAIKNELPGFIVNSW